MAHPAGGASSAPPAPEYSRQRAALWGGLLLVLLPAVAAAIQSSPAAVAAMQLDRWAVMRGQFWRLATGSLTHYGWPHLAADIGALALLCCVGLHRDFWGPRRVPDVAVVVGVGALAVGAAVVSLSPNFPVYRGASGVAHGVLAWLLMAAARRAGEPERALWLALLGVLVVKSFYEAVTGTPALMTSLPDGIGVVGVAHLAGEAVGIRVALADRERPCVRPLPPEVL